MIQDALELQIPLLFNDKQRDLWERTAVKDTALANGFVISSKGDKLEIPAWLLTVVALSPALLLPGSKRG